MLSGSQLAQICIDMLPGVTQVLVLACDRLLCCSKCPDSLFDRIVSADFRSQDRQSMWALNFGTLFLSQLVCDYMQCLDNVPPRRDKISGCKT